MKNTALATLLMFVAMFYLAGQALCDDLGNMKDPAYLSGKTWTTKDWQYSLPSFRSRQFDQAVHVRDVTVDEVSGEFIVTATERGRKGNPETNQFKSKLRKTPSGLPIFMMKHKGFPFDAELVANGDMKISSIAGDAILKQESTGAPTQAADRPLEQPTAPAATGARNRFKTLTRLPEQLEIVPPGPGISKDIESFPGSGRGPSARAALTSPLRSR